MNELEIQSKLNQAFLKQHRDGLAYKQNNRFLAGVPDLRWARAVAVSHAPLRSVDHHGAEEWNVEVKWLPHWPKGADSVALALTPLQRRWGKRMQDAGMNWGWLLVVGLNKRGCYQLYGGTDWTMNRVPGNRHSHQWFPGMTWEEFDPVKLIRANWDGSRG